MKLESAKHKLKLSNKVIEIESKQIIVEENRTLNDVEVERGLAFIRAGLTPPLSDLPPGILDPVTMDDIQSQFSTITTVAMECGMGTRPTKSLARKEASALDRSRAAWQPPEPDVPLLIDKV